MQKVQELNEKYNINEVPEQNIEDYNYHIIYTRRKRLESFKKFICSILTSYYFVEIIFSEEYDAKDNTSYKTIEILGSKQNIEMAEYVYHFLTNKLDQLWNAYRRQNQQKLSRSSKNSYCVGLVAGFHKKLDAIKDQHDKKQTSPKQSMTQERQQIVLHNDQMLTQFMRQRFPRIRNIKSKTRLGDHSSYSQGLQDGRKIILHKGLAKNKTNTTVKLLS